MLGSSARSALAALAALALLLDAGALHAGPTLEVVGTSRFDARMTRAPHTRGAVAVTGTLVDDADHPVGGASIGVRFASQDGSALHASSCEEGGAPLEAAGAGAGIVTGPDGAFCAQATPHAGKGETRVTLTWGGTRWLAKSEAELAIDPSRSAVSLAFDPDPRVIYLGSGPFVWNVAAKVEADDRPDVAPPDDGSGLSIRLLDERGVGLGAATTDAKGTARFVVQEKALAPPGPGELRLVFDGDARHARAARAIPCERRALVTVGAHNEPGSGAIAGVVAEESDREATVELDVTSPAGPVPGGSVEGLVAGEVVGASPVTNGRTRLTVRWPDESGPGNHLGARYVPDAPWYVAGAPAQLALEVRRTVPWSRIAVVAAGLVILGWFFLSRSRVLGVPRSAPSPLDAATTEAGRIERVAELPAHARANGAARWEGRVVDAHDGGVVGGAWVTLERASFTGAAELARATTDDQGRFELDATQAAAGDHIVAHGPLHARLARSAPARGVLEIALVSRRRALLRRLVEWGKRRGSPFDAPPEPTPAHIRRFAGEDAKTARWAKAVEEAAFGAQPVDAQRETEIDGLGHERGKP